MCAPPSLGSISSLFSPSPFGGGAVERDVFSGGMSVLGRFLGWRVTCGEWMGGWFPLGGKVGKGGCEVGVGWRGLDVSCVYIYMIDVSER